MRTAARARDDDPVDRLVREEFADLGDWIYLDSHRLGVLPSRTRARLIRFVADHAAPRPTTGPQWTEYVNGARAALAAALNVDEHTVAFTSSASDALSVVLDNVARLGIREVLALAEEYPPYLRYLRQLESSGAVALRVLHDFDQLLAALHGPHQLVVLSQVCWRDGRSYDLPALGAAKLRSGSMLALDVVHVVGCFPFRPAVADPEFVLGTSRKWLLGVAGLGFLHLGSRVREHVAALCTSHPWRGYPHDAQDWYGPVDTDRAERLEIGARNKLAMVALRSSLSMFAEVGFDAVATRIESLRASMISQLRANGLAGYVEARAADRSAILPLAFPDADSADRVVLALRERRVMASRMAGAVLLGVHFHVTENQLAEVVGHLTELASLPEHRDYLTR